MTRETQESAYRGGIRFSPVPPVPPVPLPAWALGPVPESCPAQSSATEQIIPTVAPSVAVCELVALPDDYPAWEQAEPPGEPCPACGSLEYWLNLLGGRHCQICEGAKLQRALRLLAVAARIRSRKPFPGKKVLP